MILTTSTNRSVPFMARNALDERLFLFHVTGDVGDLHDLPDFREKGLC
jgi:hypothetical protein